MWTAWLQYLMDCKGWQQYNLEISTALQEVPSSKTFDGSIDPEAPSALA
jgi:hypothetical protein